mmetsp:Transcript_25274/g.60405  ORF Transcript_25274/g.60405 Transcript_25274/m.60405 type:complete len:612 (-) Transcript_25274:213-2048(-)
MRLLKSRLVEAYQQMKLRARADGSPILICVASDCDAIAANHIFTTLLHADSIQYSMKPVRGYGDVEAAIDAIDKSSVKCVVLINCGAMEDIYARFRLEDAENSMLQVYVIDSHRPFSLENIHVDGIEEEEDLAKARVVLIDDGGQGHDAEIPSIEEYSLAQEEGEEDEEGDSEDEDGNPRERRKLDEEGGAAVSEEADAERDAERHQRREKRALLAEARDKVESYYNGTKRGMASAILMFDLACHVNKDSNTMLWWAIIGLTEQFLGEELGRSRYENQVGSVQEEMLRLNGPTHDQVGGNSIQFEEDFRFVLMHHWTLQKSMYHSFYVAAQLGIWKDRTTSKLQTLLAKMGYPLLEAEQKFIHMRESLKKRLKDTLREHQAEFNLDDVLFPTFFKERKARGKIAAADCYHICSAMLASPPTEGKDWTDAWFEAHDAIHYCGNKEEQWDALIAEKSAVNKAIRLQEAVVQKGFELCYEKGRIQNYPKFRVVHFTVDEGNKVLLHPMVLSRLALLLMDIDRVSKGKDPKPIIIGVDSEADETCTVAGVVAPMATGFRERNTFGQSFKEAAAQMPGMEMQMQGFDTEVITVPIGMFKDFTHAVVACMVENNPDF